MPRWTEEQLREYEQRKGKHATDAAAYSHAGLQNSKPQPPILNEPPIQDGSQENRSTRSRVCITSFRCRLLDIDNLAGGSKFLLDALRYEHLISDDCPDKLELHINQVRVPKRIQERTVVQITTL